MKLLSRHKLLLCMLAFASTAEAWASSDIFSSISLAQAKQQAKENQKLLLIDFTASWCPPCKKMEATTWSDQTVKDWIKENAIAIQIDVDKDEKASDEFKIKAMPTLVLFTPQSQGREFGRQDGYLSAAELMQWLQGAKSGKSATELEKDLSLAQGPEVWERIRKADEFQRAGKHAEALAEYIWLWTNIPKDAPTVGEIRNGMVSFEIKRVCQVWPEAKLRITELRDAAERIENRFDWVILNGILDDNVRTLAWFDKIKTTPAGKDPIKTSFSQLESVLFSSGRYADAATYLYSDPLAKLNEYYKKAEAMKHPGPHTEVSKEFDPLPSMVLLLYGSYIGAGKDAEAQKIADECLRLDNTQGMRDALSNMASGMKQALAAQKQSAPAAKAPIQASQKQSTATRTPAGKIHTQPAQK